MPPAFKNVTRLTANIPGVNLGASYGTPALRDLLNQCRRRLATRTQLKSVGVAGPP